MLSCCLKIPLNGSNKSTELSFNFDWNGKGILGFQGISGSGKTTLLKQLAGFGEKLDGTEHHIKWKNRLWESGKYQLTASKRSVTLVFQEHPLFPHMNVQQNLEFARQHSYRQISDETYTAIINDFDLNDLLQHSSLHLSGGQQSRVALVQGLLAYPELLLLDEPFAALDFETRHNTAQALKMHTQNLDISVILVSHTPHELASTCEQLLMIDQHQLSGPHQDILKLLNNDNAEIKPLSEATTFLKAKLVSFDEKHHLAHFEVATTEIMLASKHKPNPTEVIEIPASEVSLVLEKPAATSIANCIEVTLDNWTEVEDGCHLQLKFNNQSLSCKITQYSFQKLNLEKNKKLFAQFKATAIGIL